MVIDKSYSVVLQKRNTECEDSSGERGFIETGVTQDNDSR